MRNDNYEPRKTSKSGSYKKRFETSMCSNKNKNVSVKVPGIQYSKRSPSPRMTTPEPIQMAETPKTIVKKRQREDKHGRVLESEEERDPNIPNDKYHIPNDKYQMLADKLQWIEEKIESRDRVDQSRVSTERGQETHKYRD